MNLRGAISNLEEFYSYHTKDEVTDEIEKLRSRVEVAFMISIDDLQEALMDNPNYSVVEFSAVDCYYPNKMACIDTKITIKNHYIVAIVPKVIEKIWKEEFQKAYFYHDGDSLYKTARNNGIKLEKSGFVEGMKYMFQQIEKSEQGIILENVEQEPILRSSTVTEFYEIQNNYKEVKPIFSFEESWFHTHCSVNFVVHVPNELVDIIMNLASKNFEVEMQRKLV